MWCPGAAALSTCLILHIPLSRLGWRWPAKRFLWFAYLLPLLYSVPVYIVAWSVVRGSFARAAFLETLAANYGLANWPWRAASEWGFHCFFRSTLLARLYGLWARRLAGAAFCSRYCTSAVAFPRPAGYQVFSERFGTTPACSGQTTTRGPIPYLPSPVSRSASSPGRPSWAFYVFAPIVSGRVSCCTPPTTPSCKGSSMR